MVTAILDLADHEPSIDAWYAQAATAPEADLCGMYLVHHGVVRRTAKATARLGATDVPAVASLELSWAEADVRAALDAACAYPGVHYLRVWINRGTLGIGETMMDVMVGADIRPNCIAALEGLVETIKSEIVTEAETYEQ